MGARHIDAVSDELNFKEEYIHDIAHSWRHQLEVLSKIAEIQLQADNSACV